MMDRKGWKVTGTLALRLGDYMKVTIDEDFFHLSIMKVQIETVQQRAAGEGMESVGHSLMFPEGFEFNHSFH